MHVDAGPPWQSAAPASFALQLKQVKRDVAKPRLQNVSLVALSQALLLPPSQVVSGVDASAQNAAPPESTHAPLPQSIVEE